jgi:CheY-like chemotaxis protein
MSRIILIHWNAAEAEERAGRLRRAGYEVNCHADQGMAALRTVREDPPDAFVVDLNRLPSQGRAVAVWLRQQKATRHTPIVFVEGDPEKTQRVRELLPDAVYTGWDHIDDAIRQAMQHVPQDPVVPGAMDAYAGTPLPKKLGIKAGSVVALIGAPAGFERTLGALPDNARLRKQMRGLANVILLFVKSRAELDQGFPGAARTLAEGGRLWIVWPKKASGVATDLTQTTVRAFGLGAGFVDYKISAIDETWSGLCFARRHA